MGFQSSAVCTEWLKRHHISCKNRKRWKSAIKWGTNFNQLYEGWIS